MTLPQPADLTSLVLRTDFSDEAKWLTLQALLDSQSEHPHATYVCDPAYADVNFSGAASTKSEGHLCSGPGFHQISCVVSFTLVSKPGGGTRGPVGDVRTAIPLGFLGRGLRSSMIVGW
ncbi:hypothetical protein AB0K18_05450 [Nonomuraea sp. NPDC049421]|uniref:DUF6924 domain-containing protein n=1 Tax=Nonomuraea sp. NPDC049421 TaxID=3155275 RepID=UPI00341DB0C0